MSHEKFANTASNSSHVTLTGTLTINDTMPVNAMHLDSPSLTIAHKGAINSYNSPSLTIANNGAIGSISGPAGESHFAGISFSGNCALTLSGSIAFRADQPKDHSHMGTVNFSGHNATVTISANHAAFNSPFITSVAATGNILVTGEHNTFTGAFGSADLPLKGISNTGNHNTFSNVCYVQGDLSLGSGEVTFGGNVQAKGDIILGTGKVTFGGDVKAQHIKNNSENDSTIVLNPGCNISLEGALYKNTSDDNMQFVLHPHKVDQLEAIGVIHVDDA